MTVLYQEYFGLKEPPFSIAPDPRYLFMSEQHREALAHLTYGIGSDGGFILLTGDVGTGKTTVSRCILDQIPAETHIAFVLNPRLSVEELLAVICDELGIAYPEGTTSNKIFIDRINDFLLAAYTKGHKTVLVIEEAQNLSPDVLEQVRLLTNLETNQCKLLQIVLLGQPELREMLGQSGMSQLEQRITARFHLGPLSKKDMDAYVSHRLAIGGVQRQLFPASLMPTLYRLSRGVPRLINLICDRSLLGAYVQGKDKVDKATLKKAAEEVFGRSEEGGQNLKRAGGSVQPTFGWIAVGLVLLIAAAVIIFQRAPLQGENVQAKTEVLPATLPAPISPVTLQWPAEKPLEQSEEMAYQALFKEWGSAYRVAGKNAVCGQAGMEGLQCLRGLSDMQRLIGLNRPSVLKLFDDRGNSFYALLKTVHGQSALLFLGDRDITVDLKEIEKKWLGEFTLFWKAPPAWSGEIRPGASNSRLDGAANSRHIQWLAQLVARKTGDSRFAMKSTYDKELIKEIKKFQLEEGLLPDGIVGVHTVIHLNSRYGIGEPLLSQGREGI